MGLLGGSSKRLRNAVATAENQTTKVRLPGEPGSKLFSTAYNSDYWQATVGEQAGEAVRRSYRKHCAWSRGSGSSKKRSFGKSKRLRSKKLLELWQCFLLRMTMGFGCTFANPKSNPEYGDHHAEVPMLKSKTLPVVAGLASVTLLPLFAMPSALATTFEFTNSGTPACSEACSATAAITPGAGTLTVVLTDTQANPRSAGDLLSSIEITLSGSQGSPTLSSQAGQVITVASNTGPYTTSPGPPTHWGVGVSSSNCTGGSSCIALETAGPFAVGGAPINMIIGPPDASGNYSNGNASVVDGHFSPYINGTGTFVISDSLITAATTIAGVTFDFGTAPDTFQPGVPVPAPIVGAGLPGLVLACLGLLGLARRRRKIA